MLLFRKYTRDAASFEAGQAFYFGVPSREPAFEEDGCGRDVMIVWRAEGVFGVVPGAVAAKAGDIDCGVFQLASFLNVGFGDLVGAGMVKGIHDEEGEGSEILHFTCRRSGRDLFLELVKSSLPLHRGLEQGN